MAKKYNPIGKTLDQICTEFKSWYPAGVSIFVLRENEEATGVEVANEFSLGLILHEHPRLRDAVVEFTNDYLGVTVYRVRLEDKKG